MTRLENSTRMFAEAAEAPHAVCAQFLANELRMLSVGRALRELAPRAVVTCARGSSDNAATFARYLIETRTGVLTSSAAPSVTSLYSSKQDFRQTVFLAISQSGASPDLLAATEAAKSAGACVVTFVNAEGSPLARLADYAIPLCAGAEVSVAATKSYIASLAAVVHLVACWTEDAQLLTALRDTPALLSRAWELDWTTAVASLRGAGSLYVLGRGLGLGIAQEAALKLKETCGMHAEAFSSAEVRHGPMALVGDGFPVLLFAQDDETLDGVETLAAEFAGRGAQVMLAGGHTRATGIETTDSCAPGEELPVADGADARRNAGFSSRAVASAADSCAPGEALPVADGEDARSKDRYLTPAAGDAVARRDAGFSPRAVASAADSCAPGEALPVADGEDAHKSARIPAQAATRKNTSTPTEAPAIRAGQIIALPTIEATPAQPAIQPMLLIHSFYRLANQLALMRGRDPDRPPHLNKVTETL